MQHPALGAKGECCSGALLLMQKQFFRNNFLFYSTPSPRTCLQVFLFPFSNCSTAPEQLQGLGGTGSGCESPSSVTIAIQSSLTCRC